MTEVVAEDRLAALRDLCAGVAFLTDAGMEYVYLPALKIQTDGRVIVMDALLRASEHSGYPTRLFLAQALPGKGLGGGWSVHTIGGRTWHTWSWKGVPPTLPLPQILLGHLWALR